MTSRFRSSWRVLAVVSAAFLVFVSSQHSIGAQSAPKRPLTYDVVDYWRSIGATKLSTDGQWLAYALTSQGEDGELVVRNLKSGQEYKHPRGSAPQITPDSKFLVFTILPPKSETPPEGEAGATPAAAPAGGRGAAAGGGDRNSLGIMTLADGKVTTIDKVGSFKLPDESSTWRVSCRC